MKKIQHSNKLLKYNLLARVFHWGGAILILLAWAIIEFEILGESDSLNLHKSIGVSFLIWTALRFMNMVVSPRPAMVPMPKWQTTIMVLVHLCLYACMFAMPILGILTEQTAGVSVSFFGLFELPNLVDTNFELSKIFEDWHTDIVFSFMLFLIFAHVGGAIYHQVIMKDNLIARMR